MKKYTFDIKLFATIDVEANSEEEARDKYIEAVLDSDEWFGPFVLRSVCLDEPEEDVLVEIDGEAV